MDPMGFWIPGESSRKEAELLHEQIRGHAVDADAEAHSMADYGSAGGPNFQESVFMETYPLVN